MKELYATAIDEVTFEQVADFCNARQPENQRLEYKREVSSTKPGHQIAKEVASMANTQGGMIIFGIEEDGKTRRPIVPIIGSDLDPGLRQTILTAAAQQVFPPIGVEVSDLLANPIDHSRSVLIVRVPVTGQLHTIDAGTGIYIRQSDQAEPIRADIEQIAQLLQRQQKAFEVQRERRKRMEGALSRRLGNGAQGVVWVSIGPQYVSDPLIDLKKLRESVATICAHSAYWDELTPVAKPPGIGVLDGLYSFDGERGGYFDIYGNSITYSVLTQEKQAHHNDEKSILERVPKHANGKALCVQAELVIERILATVRTASRFFGAVGFSGQVILDIRIANAFRVPLVMKTVRGDLILGANNLELDINLEFPLSTECISDELDLTGLLIPVTHRLLWAWGCTEDNLLTKVFDQAERKHYGDGRCPKCGQNVCPQNREICISCRVQNAGK